MQPDLPDKADQDFYILFRRQVDHEDNLVNHRMTWLLLLQAFLLAILGGALSQAFEKHFKDIELFKWLLAVIGMVGSISIAVGIWAAQKAIRCLAEDYGKPYGGLDKLPKHLPSIRGGETPHIAGLVPLWVLPVLCVSIWSVIGCTVH